MSVKTYSADEVTVLIGSHIASAFADGTFVQIEENGDGVTSVSGADGEVARSMSTDRRKKVTITLLQTSDTNDVLSGLYNADRISKNVTFPLTIKDLRGRTMFAASTAWVTKSANVEFGKAVGSREWTLETSDGIYFVGGNE